MARFKSALDGVDAIAGAVHRRLGELARRAVTRDDLRGFGREGLLEAARSFDASRGVPFSRWARVRIRGAMIDGLRQWGLTRRTYGRLAVLRESDGDGRLREAGALFCTVSGLGIALAALGGGSDEPEPAASPEELFSRVQTARQVRLAIDRLPRVERVLVERCDLEEQTLEQAAAAVGISKPWASRLRARALGRLADVLRAAA